MANHSSQCIPAGMISDAQDWVIAASMKLRNRKTRNHESVESIGLTRTTGSVNPVRTKLDVIVTPAELDEALALDPEMLFLDQHRLFDESHQI